jgi:hypothetical protein
MRSVWVVFCVSVVFALYLCFNAPASISVSASFGLAASWVVVCRLLLCVAALSGEESFPPFFGGRGVLSGSGRRANCFAAEKVSSDGGCVAAGTYGGGRSGGVWGPGRQ